MEAEAVQIKRVAGQQVISLPSDMVIDDDMVYVKKEGNVVHLIPYHNSWQSLVDSLDEFTPDFMREREQPATQTRESLD